MLCDHKNEEPRFFQYYYETTCQRTDHEEIAQSDMLNESLERRTIQAITIRNGCNSNIAGIKTPAKQFNLVRWVGWLTKTNRSNLNKVGYHSERQQQKIKLCLNNGCCTMSASEPFCIVNYARPSPSQNQYNDTINSKAYYPQRNYRQLII